MSHRSTILALTLSIVSASCGPGSSANIDRIAEAYVSLALSLGEHDADYVDAYYGPEEWREEAKAQGLSVSSIRERGEGLLAELGSIPPTGDELELLRFTYLRKQLESLVARADILSGRSMSFDEESLALYDAVAPRKAEAHFESILLKIDSLLPGTGPLYQRYEDFIAGYRVPRDVLEEIFERSIQEARVRTADHIDLPVGETFRVEYVQDKTWGGYNWYQGGYSSLIQVNIDVPRDIGQVLHLACHEGYPGHHVYNSMLEHDLVNGRGWPEHSVYPLFSPQSLIAEGAANFGCELAFPEEERAAFEREVLFPMAGLDPTTAPIYHDVQDLVQQLNDAGTEAARLYLDGEIDEQTAAEWLVEYAMTPAGDAMRNVRFYEQYRSYQINYTLGLELVRDFIDATGETQDERWVRFKELLTSPRLPGDLLER